MYLINILEKKSDNTKQRGGLKSPVPKAGDGKFQNYSKSTIQV